MNAGEKAVCSYPAESKYTTVPLSVSLSLFLHPAPTPCPQINVWSTSATIREKIEVHDRACVQSHTKHNGGIVIQ